MQKVVVYISRQQYIMGEEFTLETWPKGCHVYVVCSWTKR